MKKVSDRSGYVRNFKLKMVERLDFKAEFFLNQVFPFFFVVFRCKYRLGSKYVVIRIVGFGVYITLFRVFKSENVRIEK